MMAGQAPSAAQGRNSGATMEKLLALVTPGVDVDQTIASPVSTSTSDTSAIPADVEIPLNAIASEYNGAEMMAPAQSVQIYPKSALALLKLKCPAVRNYLGSGAATASPSLHSGLDRTLQLFEDTWGPACRLNDSSLNRAGQDTAPESSPNVGRYTCAQARTDGSNVCPTEGCVLPTGMAAEAPTDLLMWDCNLKGVGQATIAKSVATSEFGFDMITSNDKVFMYEDGSYRQLSDAVILKKVLPHLGMKGNLRTAIEIANTMRVTHAGCVEQIIPSSNHVCFKNGTLNVVTRQLEDHSPANMLLNRIGHDYVADAQCHGFIAFLNSIWANDADRVQKIRFIRQWIGYLLVADASLQKMVILKGEGSNGKSVLMDLIRTVIGEANTASANVDRFRMAYVRSTLEGKLLNLSADLPKRGAVSDGDLKAIVSGDTIEVSPKHKPSYAIKPFARLMVATNNMPPSRDTSDGYFRRLVILNFNRKFSEAQQDPHLLGTLLRELPGIVAWAVDGLYDLRNEGRFTVPSSSTLAVQAYREELSSVSLFAEECLVHSPNGRTGFLPKDLFMAFRLWCRDRGFDAGNMVTFGRELSTLGFNQRKSGFTWWLVSTKEGGEEYFNPAVSIPADTSATLLPITLATQ
jgi:putative DNA primase/helicase